MKANHRQVQPGWSVVLLALSLVACDRPSTAAADATRPQTRTSDAFLVLPGDYSEHTTVADLQARFGKEQVRLTPGADQSLVLFPDDPLRRAYVSFHDDEKLEIVSLIEVRDAGSLWRGKRGVHLGMSFAALEQLNGKPFGFSGFDDQRRAWRTTSGAWRKTTTMAASARSTSKRASACTSMSNLGCAIPARSSRRQSYRWTNTCPATTRAFRVWASW